MSAFSEKMWSMTGSKTSIRFNSAVMPIVRCWRARGWDLQNIVNAGIVLFHMADASEREAALATASIAEAIPLSEVSDDAEFRKKVIEMVEALKEIPAETGLARKAKSAKSQ